MSRTISQILPHGLRSVRSAVVDRRIGRYSGWPRNAVWKRRIRMDEVLRNLAPPICVLFVALAGHFYARRLGRQAVKARETPVPSHQPAE